MDTDGRGFIGLYPCSSVSVSVQIVAGRDDFAERGSVSRSRLIATDALDLSKRWGGRRSSCGSQTRAPVVAAPLRWVIRGHAYQRINLAMSSTAAGSSGN